MTALKPTAAAPVHKPKKELRPHQTSAKSKVVTGLESADRGKLIMACGTGKTFTSLKIAEEVAGKNKRVLFLVPSLNLLSQTLAEWTRESAIPLPAVKTIADSRAFSQAGREPAHWDLNYETVDRHPGVVVCGKKEGAASRIWRSGCRAKRHSLILSGGHVY
jgi:predicted helicase